MKIKVGNHCEISLSYIDDEVIVLESFCHDSLVDKIVISDTSIRRVFGKNKGSILKNRVKNIFFIEKDFFGCCMVVYVMGDSEWNQRMKSRHPILWRLGLITKYNDFSLNLGCILSDIDVNNIVRALINLEYTVVLKAKDGNVLDG